MLWALLAAGSCCPHFAWEPLVPKGRSFMETSGAFIRFPFLLS